ncbi:Long-chain-fatty-acid--CoA ligase 6 [Myotis davidii]|uniref:Long-chain-fatty-acid--CoA ligase 6 n=1 Tax=Myotis davidii TaxID=225400 RepID=L5M4Z7_MYODS|nr:Long-chain-fatty-acid--CoA ligase 6 [Myotis davidii]
MQTQEILRMLRLSELGDLGQFFHSLSATTLMSMGALAAILAYWFTHRPKALQPPCNLLMQSEEVEGSGGARRSVIGDGPQLLTHYYDDARTMYQVFRRGLSISGNGPCLGFRKPKQPYQWLSYQEVANRAEFLGSGLLQHNCKACTDQFIGVFAQNRPEWIIAELACYTYSMVVVPLYDTLGPGAIRYIINTADISTVIVDKPQKAQLLLEHVERKTIPGLKMIILMDPFEEALKDRGQECGVVIKSMQAVEPPNPSDLSIVCFTSGTTGTVEGVWQVVSESHFPGGYKSVIVSFLSVSHAHHLQKVIFPRQDDVLISFLPLAHMFERVIQSQWAPTCADVHISYLPLAHMFERMVQSVVYCHGGRVGFFQGDIRLLSDDMKALRPTIFPIFSQANTPLKRWLLEFAAKRKQAEVRSGIIRNDSIWDELFFNKIQVYEGYGQTECTAGCTFTTPGDWTSGHVGAPLPCNHIKLVDVVELNYWTRKGEGEICVRGPNVFKGYLKDPDKTKEALDSDGWLHTGDIGQWLPAGTLKIIGRKKHIFKLAQGEYVAPEKIENIYTRSEPVAQTYVHGDSLQELKKAILEDMVRLGKESGLHSFEQGPPEPEGWPPGVRPDTSCPPSGLKGPGKAHGLLRKIAENAERSGRGGSSPGLPSSQVGVAGERSLRESSTSEEETEDEKIAPLSDSVTDDLQINSSSSTGELVSGLSLQHDISSSLLSYSITDSSIEGKSFEENLSSFPSPELFRGSDYLDWECPKLEEYMQCKNSTLLDTSKAVAIEKAPQFSNLSAILDPEPKDTNFQTKLSSLLKIKVPSSQQRSVLESNAGGKSVTRVLLSQPLEPALNTNPTILDKKSRGLLTSTPTSQTAGLEEFNCHVDRIFEDAREFTGDKVAAYIPQLAKSIHTCGTSPCVLWMVSGSDLSESGIRGPHKVPLLPPVLCQAPHLCHLGTDYVHQFGSKKPSGLRYNKLSLNEGRISPNPMANTGAIVISSLIKMDCNNAEKFDFVLQDLNKMARNEYVGFSNATFQSEKEMGSELCRRLLSKGKEVLS